MGQLAKHGGQRAPSGHVAFSSRNQPSIPWGLLIIELSTRPGAKRVAASGRDMVGGVLSHVLHGIVHPSYWGELLAYSLSRPSTLRCHM